MHLWLTGTSSQFFCLQLSIARITGLQVCTISLLVTVSLYVTRAGLSLWWSSSLGLLSTRIAGVCRHSHVTSHGTHGVESARHPHRLNWGWGLAQWVKSLWGQSSELGKAECVGGHLLPECWGGWVQACEGLCGRNWCILLRASQTRQVGEVLV